MPVDGFKGCNRKRRARRCDTEGEGFIIQRPGSEQTPRSSPLKPCMYALLMECDRERDGRVSIGGEHVFVNSVRVRALAYGRRRLVSGFFFIKAEEGTGIKIT